MCPLQLSKPLIFQVWRQFNFPNPHSQSFMEATFSGNLWTRPTIPLLEALYLPANLVSGTPYFVSFSLIHHSLYCFLPYLASSRVSSNQIIVKFVSIALLPKF